MGTKKMDNNTEFKQSIDKALRVLNDASTKSSGEIVEMIDRDYQQLQKVLSEVRPEVKHALKDIKDTTTDSLTKARDELYSNAKQKAAQVDASVHEDPWKYILGTAAAGAAIGYVLGRKSKES